MTAGNPRHPEIPASAEVVSTTHLEVHPSVVFKLGADLITDDMQALIELVKNSYDADASLVQVAVDTEAWIDAVTGEIVEDAPDENPSRGDRLRGRIVVRDDGTGMDLDRIRRGWLTVSSSHKHDMKVRGDTTAKSRTPLGDKGLGRLGAQRLGDVMTLTTRQRIAGHGDTGSGGESALRVTIRWSDFADAENLSAVPIRVERVEDVDFGPGTELEIRGLRDSEFWRQGETESLQRELATMISPYEGVSGFRLSLTIDGVSVNLREKAQAILDAAPVVYEFKFDGGALHIDGRFSSSFLRPQGRDEVAVYERLVGSDNGFSFAEWLFDERQKNTRALGVEQGDDKHFIFSHRVIRLEDLVGVEVRNATPVTPGPFSGSVSGIPLSRDTTNVFDRVSEYKDFVKALVGIKVYRDGFGIRVDDDWLGLGGKWTSGSSFYTLRPGNVVGYVNISASENAALEETTNREAFRDTPAYRNFYSLLSAWADYSGQVQEHIRRSYNDFKRDRLAESAAVDPVATPEQILERARSQVADAGNLVRDTSTARDSLDKIRAATSALREREIEARGALFSDTAILHAIDEAISRVDSSADEADQLVRHLDDLATKYDAVLASLDLLAHQAQVAQSQISDAWESVALGLSAEALAHEVQHISDGLRGRCAQITKYLKAADYKDQRVWTFVEHVRSSASALSKQTSRLTPSLRFVRERREEIQMSRIATELADYFGERWGDNGLNIEVRTVADFSVRMNKGRLTQVLDNLILNSEYWLLEQVKSRKLDTGRVTIEIERPRVLVWDNGPGVDPSVEELVFDPFVTLKPSQQGRGLGLFVARQLLDAEQASIALAGERNRNGRRHQFLMDFSGALSDGLSAKPEGKSS